MSARYVLGDLRIKSEGDAQSDYAMGSFEDAWEAAWAAFSVAEGTLTTETTLNLPLNVDEERRTCFAVSVLGATIKRNLDPDFNWDGGNPPFEIDLSTKTSPPVGTTNAYGVYCGAIWVMTDKFTTRKLALANTTSGRWYFIEGELDADHRIWDPTS